MAAICRDMGESGPGKSLCAWNTGIPCVIGIPIAVYAAQEYLKDFIYRLEGYWWIFVVAVLLTGLIAFVSVIWQVLKAAKTNPAIELKKE